MGKIDWVLCPACNSKTRIKRGMILYLKIFCSIVQEDCEAIFSPEFNSKMNVAMTERGFVWDAD